MQKKKTFTLKSRKKKFYNKSVANRRLIKRNYENINIKKRIIKIQLVKKISLNDMQAKWKSFASLK